MSLARRRIFVLEPVDPAPFILPLPCECCLNGCAAAVVWFDCGPRSNFFACRACAVALSQQSLLECLLRRAFEKKGNPCH
jgi:hypothetical protein